jgi:hypothetical protein
MGNNATLFFQRNLGRASSHSLDASARHGKLNAAGRQRLLTMLPPLLSRRIDQYHPVTRRCICPLRCTHGRALPCGCANALLGVPIWPTHDRGRAWSITRPPPRSCAGHWGKAAWACNFSTARPRTGATGCRASRRSRSASSSVEGLTSVDTAAPCVCAPPGWHRRPGSSR